MHDTTGPSSERLLVRQSRRRFLRASVLATGGLAGALTLRRAPAYAQKRQLTILAWTHFVPDSDKEFDRQAADWGKMSGVDVRVDHIAHLQLPAKRASEAQAGAGHDLMQFAPGDSAIYQHLLADLDDVTQTIAAEGGGWEKLANTVSVRDGHWKTVPWFFISFPLAWRSDLFEEVGEKLPDTWEDLLRAGKKLKAKGHPLGLQFGHSNDANNIERMLMWAYGASEVGKDSKTITVDTKEMVAALEFAKRLHVEANDPTTIAWDDASNNRCLAAGKCAAILNPISAWSSIDKQGIKVPGKSTPLAQVIDHDLPPAGPAGRFSAAAVNGLGVWKFSKNQDLAKEFLKYHFGAKQHDAFITQSRGYNQPLLKRYASNPVWESTPKFHFARRITDIVHTIGYPGQPTGFSQTVFDLYVIPDMFAQVITGRMSPKESIAWADKTLKDIYSGHKSLKG
jgi:multiple sugar transport system substrate-binding protein